MLNIVFNLKKVSKDRKRLDLITKLLFLLFQIRLRYKEKRKDYGIEIFEYFYLPWRTDENFNKIYEKVSDFTLNPKSRLYTHYNFSKKFLIENTAFIEVGCWNGGVSGLISMANTEKNIDYILCDTFSGVKNASENDSFFKNNEYSDASIDNIKKLETIANQKYRIVEGIFPNSISDEDIKYKISYAHIDVDTYISAKESFEFIVKHAMKGALIVLDDYGGWFTDGVTKFGNEILNSESFFAVPNHLGQLLIFKNY